MNVTPPATEFRNSSIIIALGVANILVSIISALFGLYCTLVGGMYLMATGSASANGGGINRGETILVFALGLAFLIFSAALFTSGVGLIMRAAWSRPLAIIVGLAGAALCAVPTIAFDATDFDRGVAGILIHCLGMALIILIPPRTEAGLPRAAQHDLRIMKSPK